MTYTARIVSEITSTCSPRSKTAPPAQRDASPTEIADNRAATKSATISIIIPTLNEQANITRTLQPLDKTRQIETIVVDGGSDDRTATVARDLGAAVIESKPGRAKQMNTGARLATGDILLFLHADTILPHEFDHHVRDTLNQPDVIAGAFRLGLDVHSRSLGLLKRLVNWRSRRFQLPYGDQALFMSAETFFKAGAYPDVPIMEDFMLVRRLRRLGRIALTDAEAITSARRWQQHGVLRVTLIHQLIIAGHFMGLSPNRLARWRHRLT